MTKVKLPHTHNGKRPPAIKGTAAGPGVIRANSIITLVFISSLLIWCCCWCCLSEAARQQQVHDSISDSSSSQRTVSNLSARSQQPPPPPTHKRQSLQRATEDKNNPNRLLVERDLSPAHRRETSAADLSGEPTNNGNEPTTGEGPLNGDESESGDDSAIDYETSDAPTEAASDLAPPPRAVPDSRPRPSRQSITSSTTTTTTTTTKRPETTTENNDFRSRQLQFVSNSRGGISLQPSAATEPTTFNVNMGSDRLLIKPHSQQPAPVTTTTTPRRISSPFTTTTTTMPTTPAMPLQRGRDWQEPRASESVNHEFITTTRNPHNRQFSPTNTNERRQDLLLYPANNNYNGDDGRNRPTTFMPRMDSYPSQDQSLSASDLRQHQPSICYTPMALMLVVLMTMMTTLVVCFCTHLLVKHFARRNQFDLVASSRQFDTKHAGSTADHWPAPIGTGGCNSELQVASKQSNANHNNLLGGLFGDRRSSQRRDDEFAFDNPYFRDEQLRQQQQQQQQLRQQAAITTMEAPHGGSEQMHFIQHHISNLHTRQVTSSVKELSGANNNQPAATQQDHCGGEFQVVDLTSQEQRNKIIADPKEGDLIAVDITGQDFIGLGFDVCGSQHEGIFVRSLLARGPAKESGCIQVGDRIKCLNVSFDNITLQDARDILNCGAPYRMRILLEKGAAALVSQLNTNKPTTKRGQRGVTAQTLLDKFARQETAKQQPIRACLRKLGNFVARAPDYENHHRHQQLTRANLSEQQLAGFEQQVVGADWLGSAAARQQRALVSPFAQGHLNLAFGGSENELPLDEQQQQLRRGDTIDSACSVNLRSGRLSSIDSGGQEMVFAGGRRNSSLQQPLGERADSSLEHFHTQNVNHRLHGPGTNKRNNLHLAMDGDTTDSDNDTKEQVDRRRRRRSGDLGVHLEQTQSQPEIAPRTTPSQQQRYLGNNISATAAAAAASGRFDINDDDDENNDTHADGAVDHGMQQNHKTMLSSISTPTMNLLPLNSTTGGLERRPSSRRRRKEDNPTSSSAAAGEHLPMEVGNGAQT